MRRYHAVAVVKDLVSHEEGQLVFQPLFLAAQALVDPYGSGRLEARTYQGATGLAPIAVEPFDVQGMLPANRDERIQREGHLPLAALLRRAFYVGKIIVPGLLPDSDQELRELAAGGTGLR